MLLFTLLCGVLLAITLLVLLRPVLRGDSRAEPPAPGEGDSDLAEQRGAGQAAQREDELAIHADRMAAINASREAGDLSASAADIARTEAERELLRTMDGLEALARRSAGRGTGRRATGMIAAGTAVVLAAGLSGGLYWRYGNLAAIEPSTAVAAPAAAPAVPRDAAAAEMKAQADALAVRLATDVDDGEGWRLLASTRMALGDTEAAVPAFERARALLPGADSDAQLIADHAEALALRAGDVGRSGALGLVERALLIDPDLPKALWLDGLGALQTGDTDRARMRFAALLPRLQPDSPQHATLSRLLEQLDADPGAGETVSDAGPEQTAGAGPSVSVELQLDPALADKVPDGAVLFVFARDAAADPDRPSPPLAAVRVAAPSLPSTISLDRSSAMIPGRDISTVERIVVVARLSASGSPTLASGDLQGESASLDPRAVARVQVTIDRLAP